MTTGDLTQLAVGDVYAIRREGGEGDGLLRIVGVVNEVDGDYFSGWELWTSATSGKLHSLANNARYRTGPHVVRLVPEPVAVEVTEGAAC